MADVTRILHDVEAGDPQAASRLLPLVYDELRQLAAALIAGEKSGQTLDATALVHEAYLRLVRPSDPGEAAEFANRKHFFSAAAEAMRRILIDNARRKLSVKHGGGRRRISLDEAQSVASSPECLISFDEVLNRFAEVEPAKAELVKLRFYAGLTNAEAAAALGVSAPTTERWWAFARTWLYAELAKDWEIASES